MFSTLKKKFPYHGDISRVVRSAVRAINKGIEFSQDGNIQRINEVPAITVSIATHLSLLENIKDDDLLRKIAIKNADSVNEHYYVKGVHSKEAIKLIFQSMELSNVLKYKWVEKEEQGNVVLVYIEKTIYPPRIMKVYFNNYIKYFCKLNRLTLDISGDDNTPVYRISKEDGSMLI